MHKWLLELCRCHVFESPNFPDLYCWRPHKKLVVRIGVVCGSPPCLACGVSGYLTGIGMRVSICAVDFRYPLLTCDALPSVSSVVTIVEGKISSRSARPSLQAWVPNVF